MCDVIEQRARSHEEEHDEQDRHAQHARDVRGRDNEEKGHSRGVGGDQYGSTRAAIEQCSRGNAEQHEGEQEGHLKQGDGTVAGMDHVDGNQRKGNVGDLRAK